jgi:GNAT superfamily N-acetyltransferase
MSGSGLELRRAADSDLRAAYDVFAAAEGEVWRRHALSWSPPPFDAWSATQRHLLAQDGERSFVALDGERLVGFGAALVRGDAWFLSALFVSPEYQGRQIGRELLDRVWSGEYRCRMTITDSIQPVSTTIYARRGLIPTTPILSLSGSPRCDLPADLEAVSTEPDALTTLDRAAYGFGRDADHRFWREHAAEANLWLIAGQPIAYSYVDDQGLIGPLAGRDGEAAAPRTAGRARSPRIPTCGDRRPRQRTQTRRDRPWERSARHRTAWPAPSQRRHRRASGTRDLRLLALLRPPRGARRTRLKTRRADGSAVSADVRIGGTS